LLHSGISPPSHSATWFWFFPAFLCLNPVSLCSALLFIISPIFSVLAGLKKLKLFQLALLKSECIKCGL
jgi:hypothetical protein